MLKSMTGFGRYSQEEEKCVQTWEVRSVNSRYLDIKWRLPQCVRSFEPIFEKTLRRFAQRGRLEVSLSLQFNNNYSDVLTFNDNAASSILDRLTLFAKERGHIYTPDYNRLLGLSHLWETDNLSNNEELSDNLVQGLEAALTDWNDARLSEAKTLSSDILSRIIRMEEWLDLIIERAPEIKEERFSAVKERIGEILANHQQELDEGRFLQEITLLADKLDVSEELTRLSSHLERLRELLSLGNDAGRRLDFTMQECFREINTCGNKIQDVQISRIVVDFKNELEKCREQVQNLE
ncbi:YicC/YloC family endoribonuclease [Desulfovibrio litoralis]|uniref:TIGR00255 family protein n=1 Tax=Desulfovibrio litoralis DSM 11393 TaxID=1121455 RepID=A0A1M7SFV2_9BACT|nr:YicC/YloC family endoribonuclease [Desulfovibrio litoralis]SHN57363.1 TIGR00255 family protein [Desulfovibrio litoralis DSM 11393]